MLAKRRALTPQVRADAADHAAKIFVAANIFQQAMHIACYFSLDDEFDCKPIIEQIWEAKKHCYLPIVSHDLDEKMLTFARYEPNDLLHLNRYKILEPKHPQSIAIENLDLILLPLVGFDAKGNRLGMGSGYYDRALASLRLQTNKKIFLLGIGYSMQEVETLPTKEWDVSLDGVLTEEKLIVF